MRNDTAFFEWCVRVHYFNKFNISPGSDRDLRAAIISIFFGGRASDYNQFNTEISSLNTSVAALTKIDKLRLVLNKPVSALVKAAFISTPWQRNILNAQSVLFANALRNLTAGQRNSFDKWMEDNYTRFRKSVSAPRFAMSLNTAVCPYCDKAFLDVGKQFYGELDHYLDKSTHSYYALNIYNFMPVCGVCNRKKSKAKLHHFNPASDNLNSVFQFFLSDQDKYEALVNYQTENIKIKQRALPGKGDHLTELNKRFALDDRYENMTAVVDYLAQLKRIYSPEWISVLHTTYGITLSMEQIKQLLLGQFSFRNPAIRLQPLTKLIDDLVRELNIFNDDPAP
ncbi:hypothetical protein FEI17_10205 [Kosakonia radicincitans]|uniref:hypothetical protein n=1 Tax=Kosakonia radicincitans TaxID=283686 RepID=UPI0011F08D87|nr:hypothetical protein [Kosakonia radicincitans]QEM90986.1 hypothetical protein FEI17_10205 [Kosakonia radicincitans]